MADPLFAVARKQVYYRNFNHCIATRLLTHSGTRHTYQHLSLIHISEPTRP